MPKNRPGRIFYATATKATAHNAPVIENGVPGVAIKQQTPASTAALSTYQVIGIGEKFALVTKGYVEVTTTQLPGATKGATVYIDTTNNALALATGAGRVPYGRVYELPGERGTAAGWVRVDLDHKATF